MPFSTGSTDSGYCGCATEERCCDAETTSTNAEAASSSLTPTDDDEIELSMSMKSVKGRQQEVNGVEVQGRRDPNQRHKRPKHRNDGNKKRRGGRKRTALRNSLFSMYDPSEAVGSIHRIGGVNEMQQQKVGVASNIQIQNGTSNCNRPCCSTEKSGGHTNTHHGIHYGGTETLTSDGSRRKTLRVDDIVRRLYVYFHTLLLSVRKQKKLCEQTQADLANSDGRWGAGLKRNKKDCVRQGSVDPYGCLAPIGLGDPTRPLTYLGYWAVPHPAVYFAMLTISIDDYLGFLKRTYPQAITPEFATSLPSENRRNDRCPILEPNEECLLPMMMQILQSMTLASASPLQNMTNSPVLRSNHPMLTPPSSTPSPTQSNGPASPSSVSSTSANRDCRENHHNTNNSANAYNNYQNVFPTAQPNSISHHEKPFEDTKSIRYAPSCSSSFEFAQAHAQGHQSRHPQNGEKTCQNGLHSQNGDEGNGSQQDAQLTLQQQQQQPHNNICGLAGPFTPPCFNRPPIFAYGSFEVSKMDVLSEEIWHYHKSVEQTEATLVKKLQLRDLLYYAISSIFPNMCGLYIVGSSLNGFGNNSSDMDLCLMLTNRDLDQKTDAVIVLNMIMAALNKVPLVARQQLILAKVPILRLKFAAPFDDVTVDLNANNSVAIRNTHLLCYYSSFDWRVRPLVTVVKEWARRKGINDANRSSFTSYSLVLMVIHYLQCGCRPPVLPSLQRVYRDRFSSQCDVRCLNIIRPLPPPSDNFFRFENGATLGELFIGFLDYYANRFDYNTDAISIRMGRRMDRYSVVATKRVTGYHRNHYPNGTHLNEATHGQAGCQNGTVRNEEAATVNQQQWIAQWRCICIEEPFTLANTAHSIYDEMIFEEIKRAFKEAHTELDATRDLRSFLRDARPINNNFPFLGRGVIYQPTPRNSHTASTSDDSSGSVSSTPPPSLLTTPIPFSLSDKDNIEEEEE